MDSRSQTGMTLEKRAIAKADQCGQEAWKSASLHFFPLDCESHCRPARGSYRISLKKFCRKDYGRLPHPSPSISPPTPLNTLTLAVPQGSFLSSGLSLMRALAFVSSMYLPLVGGLFMSFLSQFDTLYFSTQSPPALPHLT